jgi:hypothetical protein
MLNFPIPPRTLAIVLLAMAGVGLLIRPDPRPLEAGPFDPPIQVAIDDPVELTAPEDYRITALDEYAVTAMVMSRKRYWLDRQSDLSPVDFLLGWGQVTVEPNLSGISYRQDGRWGNTRFRYDAINLKPREINLATANTHMIPEYGNREVKRRIMRARRGDVLTMRGYLVRVDSTDGWYWESSRTRRDWGNHACELFYVTEID